MKIFTSLICLMLIFYYLSNTRADDASPFIQYQRLKSQPVNGFAWTTHMAKAFTTKDAMHLTCSLINATEQQLTFDTGPKMGNPKLILTAKGKNPISKLLTNKEGTYSQSGNYLPKKGEIAHGFTVDIRLYFGILEPGSYTLQVFYPKESYRIKDFADYEPKDIPSKIMTFTVSKGTLLEAQKSIPKKADVFIKTHPAVAEKDWRGIRTGTLTNNSKSTIEFSAYIWGHKKGQALSVLTHIQKWNPKTNWKSTGPIGFCGTGLGMYKLKPNESVKIHLNGGQHDGIYRFTLNYSIAGKTNSSGVAVSNAFFVDNFAKKYLEKKPNEKIKNQQK